MTPLQAWQHRPVLITGASGLVGSWLTQKLLERGAQVVALVRDWVPQSRLLSGEVNGELNQAIQVRGDLCDQAFLERVLGEYEIQTVFHLAAQTIVGVANANPVGTFQSNIQGTWALLEACRRSPRVMKSGEIVVASSDKAYGEQKHLPYTEETSLDAVNPYDVSKACGDLLARCYAKTYNVPVSITRCGNFYGGGDLNWNRLIPGSIRALLQNESPVIRSNGQYVRDYFYVEDGALAYLHLAERMQAEPGKLNGEAFNFSNELQLTVLELMAQLQTVMGTNLPLDIRNEATHEIPHQFLSARKARQRLQWEPSFTLAQGLARTVAWYQAHLEQGPNSSFSTIEKLKTQAAAELKPC
ncbi:MAG: GDP-mannose 4,6-dehydratase [Vampirovibrionales bacterium]|nr:GDP-mannose 4,6-dehydratase [Vampirovibrionales bacterium]